MELPPRNSCIFMQSAYDPINDGSQPAIAFQMVNEDIPAPAKPYVLDDTRTVSGGAARWRNRCAHSALRQGSA